MSFAPIVAKVSPAVVSIDITGHASASQVAAQRGGDQNPFQFFFGQPFGQAPDGAPAPRDRGEPDGRALPKIRASGSGFFISADGYVVTNNHVVENADSISIRTSDGRTLKAHMVGRDPATDLAVVKVEGRDFPFVTFEDSAHPRVGDWVVAVGNPFGLGGTATAGIVSALGRENVADSPLVDYMQIDAPINRGNSGGPTFDVQGHVVGVNTAIYSPSGGSVGIGFDIPADVAARISRQLISDGHVDHGYIGATIQQITPDLADSLGLHQTNGAIVDSLVADGPAARAGLRAGDIVTAVEGQSVKSPTELTRRVAFSRPGEALRLSVLRNGKPLDVTLKAGVRPSEQALAARTSQGAPQDDGG
jgi:serine protease Do